MDKPTLARHLGRGLEALGEGYLFYMREELGSTRAFPFGVKLSPEVDRLLDELCRQDELHIEALLGAIESLGERIDFAPHYSIGSFYYNYLDPGYLVGVIVLQLEKDARRFEEAVTPILSDATVGPLATRILADKGSQIQRLRAHAPARQTAAS